MGAVLDEKWTLERLLGSGGMGAVYAARHRNGARAAVKILHPELARMPEVRERFLREGYAANRVEHRGAVKVLDDDLVRSGPDESSAYLVMELLEGESLQERVARPPKLVERELLELMDAVLDVLASAHEHGVVHRDLKPENVFLARDPERDGVRVKVLDFGLARVSETSNVTNAGIAVGTPSFMSPEQAAGRGDEIDGRTDIFALGATMFRIVTGRRIHDADNMVQLVVLMATVPAPRLQSIAPAASDGFARIVDRALAFDRNDRYLDANAMRADVRALLESATPTEDAPFVAPFSARHATTAKDAVAANGGVLPAGVAAARPPTSADVETSHEESVVLGGREGKAEGAARSTTLPWALVLLLLAAFAWKLGPSVQRELVRRASLEPVRKLWVPVSVTDAGAEETSPVDSTDGGTHEDLGPAPSALDLEDGAGLEEDLPADEPVHDAGARRVIPRPRPSLPTRPTKPAPKKPAPKKTWHSQHR